MPALGLHLGAYVAETIRAGLTSVRRSQMQAALALGMSRSQAIRTIILPQALIRMLPALGSLFVIAIKDSAIASVIAVPELLRQTQIVAGNTYRPFELYTAPCSSTSCSAIRSRAGSIGSTAASPISARHDLRLERRVGQPAAAPARRS